jgi:hypothetical protein
MICEIVAEIPVFPDLLLICRVRHRFRATFSRQPRQVRKEATVTGSFVCSGPPVPDFLIIDSVPPAVAKTAILNIPPRSRRALSL